MNANNTSQKIPCPVCKNDIHFETLALLQGAQFSCNHCDAKISLMADSIPKAKEVYQKFKQVKETVQPKVSMK